MERELDIEQCKAFAEGFLQGVQIVARYMKGRYILINEAEGDPQTGYKAGCMKRLWIRAYLWMETLSKLKDPLDYQAIAVGNRTLLEILVDLILLHHDKTHAEAAKMFWWGESEKLKGSEQIVTFFVNENRRVPDEYQAQEEFYKAQKANVENMRKTHWPARKNPTKHPDRWTGNSNLFEDIEVADQMYGSVISREIGSSLVEYYRTEYRKMNWRIHSGVAGLGDPPPQAFYLFCGFGFKWCADLAMLGTKIVLTDFGRDVSGLEEEWDRVRRKRDSVYIHELYKAHSARPTQYESNDAMSKRLLHSC